MSTHASRHRAWRLRVAVGLERSGSQSDYEYREQEDAIAHGVHRGDSYERADHEQAQATNDSALVTKAAGNQRGWNDHEEVGAIIGHLQKRRLSLRQFHVVGHRGIQGVDEVHRQAPDEKQRRYKNDCDRRLATRLRSGRLLLIWYLVGTPSSSKHDRDGLDAVYEAALADRAGCTIREQECCGVGDLLWLGHTMLQRDLVRDDFQTSILSRLVTKGLDPLCIQQHPCLGNDTSCREARPWTQSHK